MSARLSDKELHDYLEKIAARGCVDVNRLIAGSDGDLDIPEIAHLNKVQQQQVVTELRKVMQVYDSCEIKS